MARWSTSILAIIMLYGVLYVVVNKEALPGACRYFTNETDIFNSSNITITASYNETINSKKLITKKKCTGNYFGLFILFVSSMLASSFVKKMHMPPLLGMLLIGVLLRNAPYINVAENISNEWFAVLRNLALTIILTRAGLCLDPSTLRRLSAAVFRLAFTPCLVETVVDACAAYFILKFPWQWGFMLGFVLAAVSPAVVVLNMLQLEARGYGVQSGVPTLVIAAASMDDVLAITGFSLVLGISFNTNTSLALSIIRGPLEALLGVVYGCVVGVILWYLPHKTFKRPVMFRCMFLVAGGIIALLGSEPAHVHGAGAIGCLTLAFVAGIGWRRRDGWNEDTNPVLEPVDTLWWLFQPLLFSLIGAAVDFNRIEPKSIGLGLVVVSIGLLFRMLASFLVVFGTSLNLKEKLFIPFAWLPKATVQAAIGPVALDTALLMSVPDPQFVRWGLQIVTVAAIVILLTAPLGAALINLLGPRMLKKADQAWLQEHHTPSGAHGHGHGMVKPDTGLLLNGTAGNGLYNKEPTGVYFQDEADGDIINVHDDRGNQFRFRREESAMTDITELDKTIQNGTDSEPSSPSGAGSDSANKTTANPHSETNFTIIDSILEEVKSESDSSGTGVLGVHL